MASPPTSSGTGPRWPRPSRARSTRSRSIPVRCATGAAAHGAGAPGRQVGGRGITWGGTGRDIPRTLPVPCSPSAWTALARRPPGASLRSRCDDVPGRPAGAGRRVALVSHHRPGQRRGHEGRQRAGRRDRHPPRRHGAQRARHRGLGRQVLVPGRAGGGVPGRRARPLRLGRRLRRPRRLLGRVHPARHAPRPVPRRDGLLAARPARSARASSWPRRRWGRRSSRCWPTSRPSTSTRSGSSTSCSTSACCTT